MTSLDTEALYSIVLHPNDIFFEECELLFNNNNLDLTLLNNPLRMISVQHHPAVSVDVCLFRHVISVVLYVDLCTFFFTEKRTQPINQQTGSVSTYSFSFFIIHKYSSTLGSTTTLVRYVRPLEYLKVLRPCPSLASL